MFSNIFGSVKRKRSSRSTSSSTWRELYSPALLQLLKEKINPSEIEEMYSLVFFLATEKNLQDAIEYINNKKYRKLAEMLNRVPVDYDEMDYLTYDLVYIIGNRAHYIALILDNDDGKKTISLKYFTEISPLNLELFLGRRLIYPF